MKKNVRKLALLVSVLFLGLSFSNEANAQFSLRGGLTWASTNIGLGLQVGGEYEIVENLYGEADFGFYFTNVSIFEINANAQYHFIVGLEELELYPMAGLNVAFASGGGSSIGVNLGGGIQYAVTDRLKPFLESKFIIGSNRGNRYSGALGVKFAFGDY